MSENTEGDNQPDYSVGYGRPPKHSRFRPGKSGNPRGRPKGAKGTKSILRKELNQKVTITENGRKKTLTKHELVFKRLITEALKGDTRAIRDVASLAISLLGPEDEALPSAANLPPEDRAILDRWLSRQAGSEDDDV
jgi:hypothetical protein